MGVLGLNSSGRLLDLLDEGGERHRGLLGAAAEDLPDHQEGKDQHHPDQKRLVALTHSLSFLGGSGRHIRPPAKKYCRPKTNRQRALTLNRFLGTKGARRAPSPEPRPSRWASGQAGPASDGRSPGTNRMVPSAEISRGNWRAAGRAAPSRRRAGPDSLRLPRPPRGRIRSPGCAAPAGTAPAARQSIDELADAGRTACRGIARAPATISTSQAPSAAAPAVHPGSGHGQASLRPSGTGPAPRPAAASRPAA